MEEFLKKVETDYQAEIEDILPHLLNKIDNLRAEAVKIHPGIRIANDGKAAGTINREDCRILYLLVRYYKPTIIFEIGTWIGTSAMVMAEAMRKNNNGGTIYTCDVNNYYALDETYSDVIKPINAFSDEALQHLPEETKIDFVFADGELTFKTIKKMKPMLHFESIIGTHDYIPPADKGVLNLIRVQLFCNFKYRLFAPKNKTPDKWKESLIGFLLIHKGTWIDNRFISFILTLYLGINALIFKLYYNITK